MVDVITLPPLPGLPDVVLADPATLPAGLATAMTSDVLGVLSALGGPIWGIYQNGAPVILADTVVDLGYTKTFQVSDFPVESGAFASYDKVEQPFEARVRFASGGSIAARQALVSSIEAILGDLNFYDVVTPDRVYVNANLSRQDYKRTNAEGGASLLSIEVSVQEVRTVSTSSTGSNTKDPASADPVNSGTVAATPANNAQIAALGGTPITTPLPQTLGGGMNGLPVTQPSGGIGSA